MFQNVNSVNLNGTISLLDEYFSKDLISNIAIKIGKKDMVLGELYRSKNAQIKETTLFDMASVTKIMATTTLTLIAIDENLLSYDTLVSEIFPQTPEHFKNLKISHLLTHTIGFGYKDLRNSQCNYDNIHNYILNIKGNPIGVNFEYSCPAFILLGKIIENIYRKRLDVLFEEKISIPLKLENTTFNPLKKGYSDFVNSNLSDKNKGLVNDYNCGFLGGVAGNAGLFSCIKDVTTFVKMLINNGNPLISKETLDSALKNYTQNMSDSRGMGFVCSDKRYTQTGMLFNENSFGHCGHTGQSVFFNIKSGLYVIVLSDITVSTIKKYGKERYGEVMKFREEIHNEIKKDLVKEI